MELITARLQRRLARRQTRSEVSEPMPSTRTIFHLCAHGNLPRFSLALMFIPALVCGVTGCVGRPPQKPVEKQTTDKSAEAPLANKPARAPATKVPLAPPESRKSSDIDTRRESPKSPAVQAQSPHPSKPAVAHLEKESANTPTSRELPQDDLSQDEKATVRLFATASPAVVHIMTRSLERDFFSMNTLEIPQGEGTGILWDRQGHVVTNYHVIENADKAHVSLADHSSWPAQLVGVAPSKDLAVLKIGAPPQKLHPLPIGTSSKIRVGQKALAIGNPFGLDHTLTTGVISALGRELGTPDGRILKDVIQTDAAINPGNSGGPLLNSSGQLIGVTTAIYSPSGAYAGIGFAIPADVVAWVVPELIAHGKIVRPTLRIAVASDRLAEQLGLSGVLVMGVEPGSSAERAGLQPTRRSRNGRVALGDIIVAVGDVRTPTANDLLSACEMHKAGESVTLTVMRGDKEIQLPVQLEATK